MYVGKPQKCNKTKRYFIRLGKINKAKQQYNDNTLIIICKMFGL